MDDRGRVLRPLDEAQPAIDQLQVYESPVALTDALRATWHAVDTTLRTLLRSEPRVADGLRLSALSRQDVPLDAVVTELRRHDLLSLSLAGRIHELSRSMERVEAGDVHAADADHALDVVDALRAEVLRPPRSAGASAVREPETVVDDDVVATASGGERRPLRRPIVLATAAVLVLAAAVALIVALRGSDDIDQGIGAFQAGRAGVAEQHFRSALQRDRDNVTARLYLARILRDQGRHQESADLLRQAVALAPEDAAVRRELGYLFLTLSRPEQAAQQFQRAIELEPGEPMGWVGLVHALRSSGNTSAAETALARAPAAAQAMIRSGRQP
jgi:tetratricopeptide (TPR) repeat protein